MTTLLQSDDAADVGTNLTVLRRIGRDRGRALAAMQTAQRQADLAADAAATASEAAADAAVEASAAKQASEQAVNAQRRLLGVAESSLAQSNDDVSNATAREAGLRAALLAQASAPANGSGSSKDNRVTGQVGTCTGAAVEQYANGQIPVSALCPLRSAAGHYLRADAAYAFDRLGQAYAGRFGTAICITDSYRSYAAQVSVYARKPGLAAVPGTSNHGWGTAVDLCGGIQSFSSAQHRWMSENASLYGWFHPGWAQQNGSKPEPWHWEYGG
jgi:LAS superfamily LD-carboxypeptidase LdcB